MITREIMTSNVVSVPESASIREIAKVLVDNGISGVPVVNGSGIPIGMVSEINLIATDPDGAKGESLDLWLTRLAEGEAMSPKFLASFNHCERIASEIMATPTVTVADTTELSELARLFIQYKIKRLPVMAEGQMVGIVSRADLVRQIAEISATPQTQSAHPGLLSEVIANIDTKYTKQHTTPPPPNHEAAAPLRTTVTAKDFNVLASEFDHKTSQHLDDLRQSKSEHRKKAVQDLIDHHLDADGWDGILQQAQVAASAGEKELLILRFPCELCSDGGRAINVPENNWAETLRGEASEIYLNWERDLKPKGFHLSAQVIDFPGGFPGDIGLTLSWGE